MPKDRRYNIVKNLIESGHISQFREIFDILPKSVVYKDLGMNNERFTNLMENVHFFLLNDIFRIAELIETDKKKLLEITYNQYQTDLVGSKKSKARKRNKS